MFVTLKHHPNPDLPGGYWQPPLDPGRAQRVPVASLDDAARAVRTYIERNGLGGGNFPAAPVTDARGRRVATVSFNGRVWGLDGNPIETPVPGVVTPERERTAAEAYAARRQAVDAKLHRLRAVLRFRDRCSRKAPRDWGLVGDIGSIDKGLGDILDGCEAAERSIAEARRRKAGDR